MRKKDFVGQISKATNNLGCRRQETADSAISEVPGLTNLH